MSVNLPTGWRAHGRHKLPLHLIGGSIPRSAGVHYCLSTANPATTAAIIAQIAVNAATGFADAGLPTRRSEDTSRAITGFLGSRSDVAPVGVVIINSRPEVPVAAAVPAAALVAGARRPLDIAWTTRITGAAIADAEAIRRAQAGFQAALGLIVLVQNFAGCRDTDSAPHEIASSFATTFHVPVLIVTAAPPACLNPDGVIFGLTDAQLSCDNPASGQPFAAAIAREEIVIDGDPVMTASLGPCRAWAPATKPKAPQVAPPVGRPKRREASFIYLLPISSNRELTAGERDLIGEAHWTSDRLQALKLAAQTPGQAVIAVVHAPDRDAAGDNANADVSWLSAEIRHQNLAGKIEVERAPFGVPFAGPERVIAA